MGNLWNGFVQIIVAIIVVAIIAVIFSKKSSSAQTIQAGTGAFNSLLKIILSPIQQGTSSVSSVPFDLGHSAGW